MRDQHLDQVALLSWLLLPKFFQGPALADYGHVVTVSVLALAAPVSFSNQYFAVLSTLCANSAGQTTTWTPCLRKRNANSFCFLCVHFQEDYACSLTVASKMVLSMGSRTHTHGSCCLQGQYPAMIAFAAGVTQELKFVDVWGVLNCWFSSRRIRVHLKSVRR